MEEDTMAGLGHTDVEVDLLQKAFNPVAAVDTAFWNENKLSNEAGQWPVAPSTISVGANTRTLTVFNDTFAGERLDVTWNLRQGSPTGTVLDQGTLTPTIALGERAQLPITFTAPDTTETGAWVVIRACRWRL